MGLKSLQNVFFKPLDVPGPLKMKGYQMPHFKESDSDDQRGPLACLCSVKAELKPKPQISSSSHHTVSRGCPRLGPTSGRELTGYTQQSCGGEGMPRKESTGTYNTGCWGQGEACLAHLGMNTEGREGKMAHLRGARSQGTRMVLCCVPS